MKNLIDLKEYSEKEILHLASRLAISCPEKTLEKIVVLLELLVPKKHKKILKTLKEALKKNHPQAQLYWRILKEVNPNNRDKILTNLVIQGFILNQKRRERASKKGFQIPFSILISPTMRCNLSCIGCYAGNYTKSDDLEFEVVDRIIQEGKEAGVAFFTILGGEPFMRSDLFDLYQKHNDAFFQVYTNGTLINNKVARKLAELGNAMPMVSIEGFEKETDQRRGRGVYKKIIKAMEILQKHRVPFGYSVAVVRENIKTVTSDKFIDMLIKKGALIGWYFLYMPIGKTPDLSLMPTPKQRLYLKKRRDHIRANKPLFIIDFWNDAPYVGGCIAAKDYIHINHRGEVEPCIFTHFTQVNIKNTSLKKAMNCQFFKEIRKRQPYSDNLYLPCMLIDHPQVSRELYQKCDIYPTHEGAESLFFNLAEGLDKYAKGVKNIYRKVWEKEKGLMKK